MGIGLLLSKRSLEMIFLLMISLLIISEAGLVASSDKFAHSHTGHENGKERVTDGGFSQHSNKHYSGGEHRSEFDHEAILGSRGTAEEFDHLPPEESKKRLRTLAIGMDKDQDGHIDREELINWILNSFKLLNKEDAEERHEESDSNSDGFVTWDEYLDENYGMQEFEEDDVSDEMSSDRKMIKEDKELFAASDFDGDEKLSKSEFIPFSHPEEYNFTSEILLRRTMEEKDSDNDGFLSLEEYLGKDANYKDKEWYLTEKDKFDTDYDADHDGKLSPDETLLWLAPDERDSAEQEADHLIEKADSNQDGILSIEEIVDNHDSFVGSEATDYGQHLRDIHKFKDEL